MIRWTVFFTVLTSFFISSVVHAHFNLNVNIRVFHIFYEKEQTHLLIRLPMAYLVADKLGAKTKDGKQIPAPYTTNTIEQGILMHYLDINALRENPKGLAEIVADNIILKANGEILKSKIGRLRAYPAILQVPFSSLKEAKTAIQGNVYQADFEATYVGDTIVDVELIFDSKRALSDYSLQSTLNPKLDKQEQTANLVIDHNGKKQRVFRIRGLMNQPVTINRSMMRAIFSFIVEGFKHILEGYDHILFIVCLMLSITNLSALFWRVSGFTLGHSITLSMGFFGYVPKGIWFISLIEMTIALSIIYVAVVAIVNKKTLSTTWTTALIGLLHGLGFSFVLQKILSLDSPNIWQSLLGFNIGIEIGQLLIALSVWLIVYLVLKKLPTYIYALRLIVALPCITIAAFWVGQRTTTFIENLIQ